MSQFLFRDGGKMLFFLNEINSPVAQHGLLTVSFSSLSCSFSFSFSLIPYNHCCFQPGMLLG